MPITKINLKNVRLFDKLLLRNKNEINFDPTNFAFNCTFRYLILYNYIVIIIMYIVL